VFSVQSCYQGSLYGLLRLQIRCSLVRGTHKKTTHAIGGRRMPGYCRFYLLPGPRCQCCLIIPGLDVPAPTLTPDPAPQPASTSLSILSLILSLTAINANKFYRRKCALACPVAEFSSLCFPWTFSPAPGAFSLVFSAFLFPSPLANVFFLTLVAIVRRLFWSM